jgi:hypothetical protein
LDAFISYDGLPLKSGGAHHLGKQPVYKIYDQASLFIKKFTDAEHPSGISLVFYQSANRSYKALPNLWRLLKRFRSLPKWDTHPTAEKTLRCWSWTLREDQVPVAFEELEHFMNMPPNEPGFGPLVLAIGWRFKFIDPETGTLLQGQEEIPATDIRNGENSNIYLRLWQKPTMSVWFAFPFENIDDRAKNYIKNISTHLPFKMSPLHWRLQKKSKNGHWLPHKIEVDL